MNLRYTGSLGTNVFAASLRILQSFHGGIRSMSMCLCLYGSFIVFVNSGCHVSFFGLVNMIHLAWRVATYFVGMAVHS